MIVANVPYIVVEIFRQVICARCGFTPSHSRCNLLRTGYWIVLIEMRQPSKMPTMMNSSVERRQYKRESILPEELFIYCRKTNRMSVVMDISMGGFKIECFPSLGAKPHSMTVDIYALPEGRFHLAGIPCRVVYDIANLAQDGTFSGSNSRISGLQYEKLTAEQKEKLEYFLNFMNPDFSG